MGTVLRFLLSFSFVFLAATAVAPVAIAGAVIPDPRSTALQGSVLQTGNLGKTVGTSMQTAWAGQPAFSSLRDRTGYLQNMAAQNKKDLAGLERQRQEMQQKSETHKKGIQEKKTKEAEERQKKEDAQKQAQEAQRQAEAFAAMGDAAGAAAKQEEAKKKEEEARQHEKEENDRRAEKEAMEKVQQEQEQKMAELDQNKKELENLNNELDKQTNNSQQACQTENACGSDGKPAEGKGNANKEKNAGGGQQSPQQSSQAPQLPQIPQLPTSSSPSTATTNPYSTLAQQAQQQASGCDTATNPRCAAGVSAVTPTAAAKSKTATQPMDKERAASDSRIAPSPLAALSGGGSSGGVGGGASSGSGGAKKDGFNPELSGDKKANPLALAMQSDGSYSGGGGTSVKPGGGYGDPQNPLSKARIAKLAHDKFVSRGPASAPVLNGRHTDMWRVIHVRYRRVGLD